MADVFLCHASEDRTAAEAVVAALENAGIECWIAPRDVAPGTDYAEAIIAGLSSSRLLLLVLSAASNDSPHVRREVERAVSRDLVILPVRIEEISPSRSLEYYISDTQWLEIPGGDVRSNSRRLVNAVRRRLALGETLIAASPPPVPEDLGPVEAALVRLVARYGPDLGNDPRRVGALLRDLAGERRAEIAAIVAAAEEGVPEGLTAAGDTMTAATVRRLTETLQTNRALAPQAADAAVRAWAMALGVQAAPAPPPVEPPHPQPAPPTEQAAPPATPPGPPPRPPRSGFRRLAPILTVGGAVAAVAIAVAVAGGSSRTAPSTSTPSSSVPTTAAATTTSIQAASTTTTAPTTVPSTASASSPVTDTTGTLSTVRPADWGYSQFEGHIYSAVDIDGWTAEYNERGWKTQARTPGFRLSLFTDDRVSDAFMQEVLNGSEVPTNCDFDRQAPSQLGGGYTAWVNTYSCDDGGTYELWAVWEPSYATYFVVFEAYYTTDEELQAVQQAFSGALWIRP